MDKNDIITNKIHIFLEKIEPTVHQGRSGCECCATPEKPEIGPEIRKLGNMAPSTEHVMFHGDYTAAGVHGGLSVAIVQPTTVTYLGVP